MISIQDRDRTILKVCYEQQFLLRSHVADHFFRGKYPAAMRRIRELCEGGYLRTERHSAKGVPEVLRLGSRGQEVAPTLSVAEVPVRGRLFPALLEHDAIVTQVRLRLEDLWVGTWIPEKAIRGFQVSEVPDGLFLFPNGMKVAVEVENSQKGADRFRGRLQRWKDFEVALVMYVATTGPLFEVLKVMLQDPPALPVFGLVGLTELLSGQPSVWSPYGALDVLSRRQL